MEGILPNTPQLANNNRSIKEPNPIKTTRQKILTGLLVLFDLRVPFLVDFIVRFS
jgi:hypothetical protein